MPSLFKKTVAEYGQKIGYEITYQDLSLSPLRLRMTLDGLRLAEEGGNQLLELKKPTIDLKWTNLIMREVGLDEVLLDEPKLLVEKNRISKVRLLIFGTGKNWIPLDMELRIK